jgi:hypothetical protein
MPAMLQDYMHNMRRSLVHDDYIHTHYYTQHGDHSIPKSKCNHAKQKIPQKQHIRTKYTNIMITYKKATCMCSHICTYVVYMHIMCVCVCVCVCDMHIIYMYIYMRMQICEAQRSYMHTHIPNIHINTHTGACIIIAHQSTVSNDLFFSAEGYCL